MWVRAMLLLGLACCVQLARADDAGPANAEAGREWRSVTLERLGAELPIQLRGDAHRVDVPIAVRNDELVVRAQLSLNYRHSGALPDERAALDVLVNEEVVGQAPLSAATAEGATYTLDIDPRTLVGFSRLGLRASLHQIPDCEASAPAPPASWIVIGNDSVLDLVVQRIPPASSLAQLPEPFFDPRDPRALRLPIVLPDGPNADELAAAGMVASWFGALAESRGWDFSSALGRLPARGNAVLVAMRPRLFGVVPDGASGAQVAVVDHPQDPYAKLLVVTGDDAASLHAAARALVLGQARASGASLTVSDLAAPPPREAYDAPRWVPTDRAVRFSERVAPERLQVTGRYPPPIRMDWDLPPDLFYWRSKGAVVDLAYRYTPTAGAHSTLDLAINTEFADAVDLAPDAALARADADAPAGLVGGAVSRQARRYLPMSAFAADNRLAWQFNFDLGARADCVALGDTPIVGAIDGGSTLDLSALPHYTQLPNLALFGDGAFPFSRYADLAQTVAVLPTYANAAEVGTFLNVLGHIGDATGYPATLLRVADAASVTAIRPDADLLVFGTPQSQPLVGEWGDQLPLTFAPGGAQLRTAGALDRLRARFDGRDLDGARHHAARMLAQAGKGLAAMISFESPLAAERTVLMFTALEPARLPALVEAMADPARLPYLGGDLALLNGEQLSAYELAPRYTVGRLPFFMGLRWHLSSQPLLLALMALALSALFALMGFASLRRRAQLRLHGR